MTRLDLSGDAEYRPASCYRADSLGGKPEDGSPEGVSGGISMKFDSERARELLAPYVIKYRALSYGDLRKKLVSHEVDTWEIVEENGAMYQFEVECFWDDEPEGDIRVIAAVFGDPRGPSVVEDFILSPSGTFIGE